MSLIIESFGGNGTLAIVKGNDLYGVDVGDKLYTEAEMKAQEQDIRAEYENVLMENILLNKERDILKTVEPPAADLCMKEERYKGSDGKDTIDKWADRYPIEIFREIMWVQMEKYKDRLGKKDEVVKEVRKIAKYAARWLQVEEL